MEQLAVDVSESEGPTPRVNFTMVGNPLKDSELIIFGGEKFDGTTTLFYADLYNFSLDKEAWTKYRSRNQPPPRSSHAATVHKSFMYIFGGEFSSPRQTQFYHYRDLWRLDTSDFTWTKLDVRGGPSARSGHRMCVCKDKLYVFGGFFDTITDMKYLNDLYMIDLKLDELKWVKIEVTGNCPSPRSGYCWVSTGEAIILYGGYCKEKLKGAKPMSHKEKKRLAGVAGANQPMIDDAATSRGIVHSEIWKFDPESKRWEKLKRSGYGPSNRSGFGMVLYKNQLVTFGGVEDEETEESLRSTFYNDLFAYNIARKKWYPMTLRKKKQVKRRRRRAKHTNPEAEPDPQDEVMEDVTEDAEEDEDEGEDEDEETFEDESKPVGRFGSAIALVKNSKLVVYGGLYEKAEQEVTLDDMWTVDLGKLDEYQLVKALSQKHMEWNASDSGEESGSDGMAESGDSASDVAEEEDDGADESEDDEEAEERKEQRKNRRSKLEKKLVTEDDAWTPRVGETLKVFFERTKLHWMQEVYEATETTGKENRRVAFQWARQRYDEIKPTLRELEELEEFFRQEQEAEERHAKKEADIRRQKNRR
uniref:DUF4110 domain-containing protein n=1 Tax=Rhodosorus marinus TaxID=101924 RepID=A0A7S2ZVZ8_9RHOD|mmetsp:Transcript_33793/g.132808  ORF Transcript_33793/g.132808 Transcript_33793/m.132808 type:complete len:589 (+) Transcript_33793:192-1958(+)